jgi:hypothetical protein
MNYRLARAMNTAQAMNEGMFGEALSTILDHLLKFERSAIIAFSDIIDDRVKIIQRAFKPDQAQDKLLFVFGERGVNPGHSFIVRHRRARISKRSCNLGVQPCKIRRLCLGAIEL